MIGFMTFELTMDRRIIKRRISDRQVSIEFFRLKQTLISVIFAILYCRLILSGILIDLLNGYV